MWLLAAGNWTACFRESLSEFDHSIGDNREWEILHTRVYHIAVPYHFSRAGEAELYKYQTIELFSVTQKCWRLRNAQDSVLLSQVVVKFPTYFWGFKITKINMKTFLERMQE